jgi:hypothetical protein
MFTARFILGPCLVCASILKMEPASSFETSGSSYIPEDGIHHEDNHKLYAITKDFTPERKHNIPQRTSQTSRQVSWLENYWKGKRFWDSYVPSFRTNPDSPWRNWFKFQLSSQISIYGFYSVSLQTNAVPSNGPPQLCNQLTTILPNAKGAVKLQLKERHYIMHESSPTSMILRFTHDVNQPDSAFIKFFSRNPILFAICTSTFSKLCKNMYTCIQWHVEGCQ